MHTPAASADRVRFGVFELELHSGELRKAGVHVSLQEQPFRILVRLLERPGELVTREQLRQELWPADTFVDFEHGLNAAIKRLRDAIGDSAETPRFIETLPRRGYRFVAPVQPGANARDADAPVVSQARRGGGVRNWLIASLVLALLIAAPIAWRTLHGPSILQSDLVVLSDFENQTTDPVLTGTLERVVEVKLSESHYINLLSDERVQDTLKTMRRMPDEPLTRALARDVCHRVGAKAIVSGTIAPIGDAYVISLSAALCSTGETVAREQSQVARKEEILNALGSMTVGLRHSLGESLRSTDAANTPTTRATTSSFEALKAFMEGERRFAGPVQTDAIPFYRRAIELDPEFAMAHAKLAVTYINNGMEGAEEAFARAFELRERLTEPEQFYVTAHYYRLGRGDLETSRGIYEVWKAAYPRDSVPSTSLGFIYLRRGDLDRAVAQFQDAVRVTPTRLCYFNLLSSLVQVHRIHEARAVLAELERTVGSVHAPARFLLALSERDFAAVDRYAPALQNVADTPPAEVAAAYTSFGRMNRAEEMPAQGASKLNGPTFTWAAAELIEQALWEAETGDCAKATRHVGEARQMRTDRYLPALMATTLAACGDGPAAAKLIAGVNPPGILGAATQARIDLASGHAARALDRLNSFRQRDLSGSLGTPYAGQTPGSWVSIYAAVRISRWGRAGRPQQSFRRS